MSEAYSEGPSYKETKRLQRIRISQQIECEEDYPCDPVWQSDFMREHLDDLVDRNAIDPVEAQQVYRDWYDRNNPQIIVTYLGEVAVSKPFYE